MADKRRDGAVVPLRPSAGRKRHDTPPLAISSRAMVEEEQALFLTLRTVKRSVANQTANQTDTQPPPRTSSSRKKTAA
jgi:hypothetical protein